jgi:cation:H+ antiporter
MLSWLWLAAGGWLLYFGAQWFVGGASALALALRIPQLIVGLTVVAYGTSAPEVVVGIQAALNGHSDVTLGNVIGSNIANIGLILGVATLIRPARVDGSLRRRELPILLFTTALMVPLMWDGDVNRVEGLALITCAVVYTWWMIRGARSAPAVFAATVSVAEEQAVADAAGAPAPVSGTDRQGATNVAPAPLRPWRASGIAVTGLVVMLVGGRLFIDGAVAVAAMLGMSERLVGLTVVAIGTSLPELLTSIIAARRGFSDLAIGNVVGSNIFNILICLGSASVVAPLVSPLGELAPDLTAMGATTLLAAYFIRSERYMARWEGGLLLGVYLLVMAASIVRG